MAGWIQRFTQTSTSGAAQTLSVKADFGELGLQIVQADVNWSSAVSSVQHKVVRDGGTASYDTIIYDETLSLTDWVWFPDFDLFIFKAGTDGAPLSDEMDFVLGAGGGAIVSRLTVVVRLIGN